MQIVQTAITAASPVLKIACFALAGVHLSRNGMLPPEGKLVLSKLGKCLFLPCLIFTKLGSTLEPSRLDTLWTIPAVAFFNVLFGLLCGTVLDRCLNTPGREGNLRTAFLAVGNLGNMPLVFVAALCDDPTSLVSGTADCRSVGQGYVMLGVQPSIDSAGSEQVPGQACGLVSVRSGRLQITCCVHLLLLRSSLN